MVFLSLTRSATLAGIFILIGLLSSTSQAAEPIAAILYPDLREPYREVITTIIEGIKEELPNAQTFAINDAFDRESLKSSLRANDVGVLIALGRGGFNAVQELGLGLSVVVGALLISPDETTRDLSGISLAADPNKLFAELRLLAPRTKTVSVVYKASSSDWLIGLGQEAARRHGLQLITYPVQDIESAAKVYRDIFNKSQRGRDAIWLLPDPAVVDDAAILPLILKSSWDNAIVVFSTNPVHAKRGALFAMFPDNRAMGTSLAKMAAQRLKGIKSGHSSIVPLTDLQAAVNTRTADHLGLSISIERQRDFALIFPAAE